MPPAKALDCYPPFPGASQREKAEWKESLKQKPTGTSLRFEVSGWQTISTLFSHDVSSFTVTIDSDNNPICDSSWCPKRRFACHVSTRSQHHFHDHCVNHHPPNKKNAAGKVQKRLSQKSALDFFSKKKTKRLSSVPSAKIAHRPDQQATKDLSEVLASSSAGSLSAAGLPLNSSPMRPCGGSTVSSLSTPSSTSLASPTPPRRRDCSLGTARTPVLTPTASSSTLHAGVADADESDNSRLKQCLNTSSFPKLVSSPAVNSIVGGDGNKNCSVFSVTAGPSSVLCYRASLDNNLSPISVLSRPSLSLTLRNLPEPLPLPRWLSAVVSRGSLWNGDDILVSCVGAGCLDPMDFPHTYGDYDDLPFFLDSDITSHRIRANTCPRVLTVPSTSEVKLNQCPDCITVMASEKLNNVLDRSSQHDIANSKLQLKYLTPRQLLEKAKYSSLKLRRQQIDQWNNDERLLSVTKQRDDLSCLMIALTTNKVGRVHQIIAVALARERSIPYIVEMIKKAAAGTYSPKGFDDEDLDLSLLGWKLGGPRLSYAMNHSTQVGAVSRSTIKRRAITPHYTTMSSTIERYIIEQNFERHVFAEYCLSKEDDIPCAYHLSIDDIKGESRLRVDDHDGKVRGLCYHCHTEGICLEVSNEQDCRDIVEALQTDSVHYATEITNIAIAPIREKSYSLKVVATSGGCRSDDPAERVKQMLTMVVETYVRDPRGEAKRGVLSTIQPDAAPTFISVAHRLCFETDMNYKHPLYHHLSCLKLMNLSCGTGDFQNVTLGSDMKHALKRTRARMYSPTGCRFSSATITGKLLSSLLLECGVATEAQIQEMFANGYADAMNVPATVKFFRAVASLKDDVDPWQLTGKTQKIYLSHANEIKLMGRICQLMVSYVADVRPTLAERLTVGSELMFLLFTCYRRNRTNFLPAQNYASWQRLLRSHYWTIATCKQYGYEEWYHFMDSGDNLEMFYCLLRTLCGGASGSGSGLDIVQAGERIGGAMHLESVFARNPVLRQKSRHLATTDDAGSSDHMNPASYLFENGKPAHRDRVNVSTVTLQHTHRRGKEAARALLLEVGFLPDEVDWDHIATEAKYPVDFLRPFGEYVGVSASELPRNEDSEAKLSTETVKREGTVTDEVKLEEALGAVPHCIDNSYQQPSAPILRTLTVDSKEVPVAQFLRKLLFKTSPTETSRVARNRNAVKSGTEIKEITTMYEGDNKEEMLLAGDEHIATLILIPLVGLTVAIVSPEEFEVDGVKHLEKMPKRRYCPGHSVTATGKIVAVNSTEHDFWWNIGSRSSERIEVAPGYSIPITPSFEVKKVETGDGATVSVGRYSLSKASLSLVLRKLHSDLPEGTVLPRPVLSFLPYTTPGEEKMNTSTGDVEFSIVLDTQMLSGIVSSSARSVETRDSGGQIQCRLCQSKWKTKEFRQHIGWHRWHDPMYAARHSVESLCGMCGTHRASTYTPDLSSECCAIGLENNGRRPKFLCKMIPQHKFSLASAAKVSVNQPCTNRPVLCPICPRAKKGVSAMVLWSYNAKQHFDEYHPGNNMPETLAAMTKVTELEKEYLLKFAPQATTRKRRQRIQHAVAEPQHAVVKRGRHLDDRTAGKTSEDAGCVTNRSEQEASTVQHVQNITQSVYAAMDITPSTRGCAKKPPPHQYPSDADRYTPTSSCLTTKKLDDGKNQDIKETIERAKANVGIGAFGESMCAALASLSPGHFLNDIVMDMFVVYLNEQSRDIRNDDGAPPPKCIVVNAKFLDQLVGATAHGTRERVTATNNPTTKVETSGNDMGRAGNGDSVLFLESAEEHDFSGWVANWEKRLFPAKQERTEVGATNIDVSDKRRKPSTTVFSMAREHGLQTIVFQANIEDYHWFFVTVNLVGKEIVVYDSCSVVRGKRLVVLAEPRILPRLRGKKQSEVGSVDFEEVWRELGLIGDSDGVEAGGDKADSIGRRSLDNKTTLKALMRPMFAQELFEFLKKQWGLHQGSYGGSVLDHNEWTLILSSELPQQKNGHDCGLYTSAGCEIVSRGGEVRDIDSSLLETWGRNNMAHLLIRQTVVEVSEEEAAESQKLVDAGGGTVPSLDADLEE